MVRYTGKLSIIGGKICIKTKISMDHDQTFDVPLIELFDELVDNEVSIDIVQVKKFPSSVFDEED